MTTALILFGHGARDPEWADPMRRVQAALRQKIDGAVVELAFLEFMAPTLPERVAELNLDVVKKVHIVPMFIARGGHLKRELPEMVAALRLAHPGIEFVLGDPVGEHERVIQAMAQAAAEVAGL